MKHLILYYFFIVKTKWHLLKKQKKKFISYSRLTSKIEYLVLCLSEEWPYKTMNERLKLRKEIAEKISYYEKRFAYEDCITNNHYCSHYFLLRVAEIFANSFIMYEDDIDHLYYQVMQAAGNFFPVNIEQEYLAIELKKSPT